MEKQSWLPALPGSPAVSAQGAREQPKGTWRSGGSPSTHLIVEFFLLFWYAQFRRQKEDTVEAGIQNALRFAFQRCLHSAARGERSPLDTMPRGHGKEDVDLHGQEEASLPASGPPGACHGAVLAKCGPGQLPHVGKAHHGFLLYLRGQSVLGLLIDQRLHKTGGMGWMGRGSHQRTLACPCSILPVPALSTKGDKGVHAPFSSPLPKSPHLDILCQLLFLAESIQVERRVPAFAQRADASQEFDFLLHILVVTEGTRGGMKVRSTASRTPSIVGRGAMPAG